VKSNIYICFLREESGIVGILNKIRQQCYAINNLGKESYLIISRNNSVVLYKVVNNDLINISAMEYSKRACYSEYKNKYLKKLSSFFRLKEFLIFSRKMIKKINPSSIYIRRIKPVTPQLIKFIKFVSVNKYKCYWEIPTYSNYNYNNEVKKNLYNRYVNSYIENNVYRIVAVAAEEGLKKPGYIFTTNGVNTNSIKLKDNIKHNGIHMICVATFDFWHGYDRLIEGLREYYINGKENKKDIPEVFIHMVGNGDTQSLQQLSDKYNLNSYIKFHGVLLGKDLDQVFDKMDLAIGNLGFHRVGVFADTSIKIREYCARGIPFITALKDSDFPEGTPFVSKVPADDSAININDVLKFYSDLSQNYPNFSSEMRQYAMGKLAWEQKMQFIVGENRTF